MNRSLLERLAALEQSTGRRKEPATPPQSRETLRADSLAKLGFLFEPRTHGGVAGGFWRRTLRYDLLTYHGSLRFADIHDAAWDALCKAVRLPVSEAHVRGLRFYDTETSGLGTGAGTFPFLHAVAYLDEDDLVLEQYFLADHGDEPFLLADLWHRHFGLPDTTVVSFNGKAFDWPLLKSRLVMHRIDPDEMPWQMDLLTPSRRLWKSKLGRVTLTNVEAGVLGLVRADDLPGSEAPARYFAFMDAHDAKCLQPVFDHNAMDVCSLVVLAALLCNIIARRQEVNSAGEYLALARWHDEWGDTDLAGQCYVLANQCPDGDWRSLWWESLHHKRRQQWAQAAQIWERMTERFPLSVPPLVELAKYAEHRVRRLEEAERYVVQAMDRILRARGLDRHQALGAADGRDAPSSAVKVSDELEALRHRLARIRKKQGGVQP